MVRQRGARWLVAVVLGVLAGAMPASGEAVGLPCLPPLPSTLPQDCPQASQAQSQQTAAAAAPSSPKTTKRFSVSATPDLARALVAEVNGTRRTRGLRPLTYSARLTNAATAHAHALATAGQFTHSWPTTGRLFSSWIRGFYPARGFRAWSAGENLLWASPGFTPPGAVQQWLDSPTHRRVLLSRSWRELGVGVVSAVAAPGAYGGRDVQIAAAEFGTRRP
jgi:uncharacterized protein YkwD